jgi:hypothetical protein
MDQYYRVAQLHDGVGFALQRSWLGSLNPRILMAWVQAKRKARVSIHLCVQQTATNSDGHPFQAFIQSL